MLSPNDRKVLKARSHKLAPVVRLGVKGLTDAAIAQIDGALQAHELVKIRVSGVARDELQGILERICGRTAAEAVQTIGRVLVIYRRRGS